MSPDAWHRLATAIEGPSELLDRLSLWVWRRYHRAQQRESNRRTRSHWRDALRDRPGLEREQPVAN